MNRPREASGIGGTGAFYFAARLCLPRMLRAFKAPAYR
jgi:hypothetical protein